MGNKGSRGRPTPRPSVPLWVRVQQAQRVQTCSPVLMQAAPHRVQPTEPAETQTVNEITICK